MKAAVVPAASSPWQVKERFRNLNPDPIKC